MFGFKLTYVLIIYVSLVYSSNCSKLVDCNNELAIQLLHVLPTDHNTFFSPLLISSSLISLLNGANGNTEKELRHLLNIDEKSNVYIINQMFNYYNYFLKFALH